MTFQIRITSRAQADIEKAVEHIEVVLKNPQAADALIDAVEAEITSLSAMPERYALVDDDVLSSWGIRFVQIKNYLAFYRIHNTAGIVYIIRFLYKKSNWASILRHDTPVIS